MPSRRVSELMNPNVVCVSPETTVAEAQKLLSARRVSGAPVVDADGQPVGVVSQSDLVRHQARRMTAGESGRFYSDMEEFQDIADLPVDRSDTPVRELMTAHVYSVTRDTGAATAASIMRERRIHRLLVTDRGRLVGVISALDLLVVVIENG
ncbi:MAG: CBS domain-containing protein [Deltaproteobacteria bacterium]|nr:CBS domain-containing protein [Deltaproteobacteria bacterium]